MLGIPWWGWVAGGLGVALTLTVVVLALPSESDTIARHQREFVKANCPGLTSFDACEDRLSRARTAALIAPSPPIAPAAPQIARAIVAPPAPANPECAVCNGNRVRCLVATQRGDLYEGSEKFEDPVQASKEFCVFEYMACTEEAKCPR